MMDMTGVKAGDEVRVFDVNGRRRGQPEDGWPGEVVSVGRKLFTVTHPGYHNPGGQVFRLESGFANDSWGHQNVITLERALSAGRRNAAAETLRRCQLQFSSPGGQDLYTTEQLEALAALAVSFLEKP